MVIPGTPFAVPDFEHQLVYVIHNVEMYSSNEEKLAIQRLAKEIVQ